jgi:class 3 adenylate cyclase
VRWLRESFGAKLLAALLGTVGLLLIVTYVVVRAETGRQVEIVVDRTIRNAGTLFEQLNEQERVQARRLARPFTESVRARALLDATLEARDYDYLAQQVDYEVQLAGQEDVLLVFTDAEGRPVLSLARGMRITDEDPADVAPLAERLLMSDSIEATSYRLVADRLYLVTALYVDLVGTITFGLPIQEEDVVRIADIGGFEACLYVSGECAVGTAGVSDELQASMEAAVGLDDAVRTVAAGRQWSIRAEVLDPLDVAQGHRVVAVPLDEVLAPFDRIEQALLVGGGGALLLSALLGAILSRSLTQPVRALVSATGRVARGDYSAEVSVTSHDEMGTLADAFNDMTRGLLLRERYRSVLNKVVSQDVAAELLKGDVELGGENRLVTILFADIRGFTTLTDGMEPQQVIGLLNECMECLSSEIDAEGGVVDKYIGDEVMAVFGAPVTQDDHARRAVNAALRMQSRMLEVNEVRKTRGERPLGIGVGINSGVAVAGNMGSTNRLNYTVVGDAVNLASRLAGQARAGEILVSGATLRLAGDDVRAPLLGERALKGFSAEVQVYAVEGIGAAHDAASATS